MPVHSLFGSRCASGQRPNSAPTLKVSLPAFFNANLRPYTVPYSAGMRRGRTSLGSPFPTTTAIFCFDFLTKRGSVNLGFGIALLLKRTYPSLSEASEAAQRSSIPGHRLDCGEPACLGV